MGTEPIVESQTGSYGYEAIVRISETIAACREPEELATTLASEIGKFLHFDHLYFVVLKENSTEIEYLLWGKSPIPMPDLPIEELPTWAAINSRDPQHTPDWDAEERFPRFREYAVDFPHGKGVLKESEVLVRPSTAVKKALETLRPVVSHTCDGHEDIVVAEGLRAYCAIPLVNRGRALGILAILRTTEAPFSQEDMNFLSRASGQIAIAIENACAYHEISQLKDKLAQEKLYLEEEIRNERNFENIIGNSPALKHVMELVETVATSDSTVLLTGETGI